MRRGTPTSILEAIAYSLQDAGAGDTPASAVYLAKLAVEDYLNQKFGAYLLEAKTPEVEQAITDLLKTIKNQ